MFETINYKTCKVLYREDSDYFLKEDLLLLQCPNGRMIDVGWYGDKKFCITVIENNNWENPSYKIENQPKLQYIEHHLQKIIDYETAVFDSPVELLYKRLTETITNWRETDLSVEVVDILKQLRDAGRTQKEVSEYLEVFGLQYIDTDEPRWNFICDMLDRVTGFCSPEFHIY